jgi:hypothetical protein
MKEVRTFSITYNGKMINTAIQLEDTVTIEIGDWYFEGEVKKAKNKVK